MIGMPLTLYQTLEDRNNPDEIEKNGPFLCNNNSAWLGHGYYFWDTHIDLAHWWGQTVYSANGYIICKCKALLNETCWDLHGNGNHRLEFITVCEKMISTGGGISWENLLVAHVVEYLKRYVGFSYEAIRAMGINSLGSRFPNDRHYIYRLHFSNNLPAYLDLKPPVQLCLLNKNALSLRKYYIAYPQEYNEYYA